MTRNSPHDLITFIGVVILISALPAKAQKPPAPACMGNYYGLYVEGTLQIPTQPLSGQPTCPATPPPCPSIPKTMNASNFTDSSPTKPVSGELVVPYGDSVKGAQAGFLFCVPTSTGVRASFVPYEQLTSLNFGFEPKAPLLGTNGATIVGTAVSGSTAVLAISSGVNKSWKVGLSITGLSIAALMGGVTWAHAGFPPFHWNRYKKTEWYYLVVRFNRDKATAAEHVSNARDPKKKDYVPKGDDLAVFAMDEESFWPLTLLLQSKTGLPLRELPTPGQSSK